MHLLIHPTRNIRLLEQKKNSYICEMVSNGHQIWYLGRSFQISYRVEMFIWQLPSSTLQKRYRFGMIYQYFKHVLTARFVGQSSNIEGENAIMDAWWKMFHFTYEIPDSEDMSKVHFPVGTVTEWNLKLKVIQILKKSGNTD